MRYGIWWILNDWYNASILRVCVCLCVWLQNVKCNLWPWNNISCVYEHFVMIIIWIRKNMFQVNKTLLIIIIIINEEEKHKSYSVALAFLYHPQQHCCYVFGFIIYFFYIRFFSSLVLFVCADRAVILRITYMDISTPFTVRFCGLSWCFEIV